MKPDRDTEILSNRGNRLVIPKEGMERSKKHRDGGKDNYCYGERRIKKLKCCARYIKFNIYGEIRMSNILDELSQISNFSNAEIPVVEYILRQPEDVLCLTLKEFAKKSFSSEATIIRVCKKIGLSGYSDLKISLASELNSFLVKDGQILVDAPIKHGDKAQNIAKKLLNLSSHALTETYQATDFNKIKRAANILFHSEGVSLYARGESLIIAEDFHMKLLRIGIRSALDSMNGLQEMRSRSKFHKETAVVISHYADSRQVKYVVKELKQAGTPLILITGNSRSPVIGSSDLAICVNTNESRYKIGAFASRVSMQFIMDCIYCTLFTLDYDKNIKTLSDYANRRGMERF